MRFYDAYEYEIDTNLCKTEQRLKDLYFKNQDRHLEKPHDIIAEIFLSKPVRQRIVYFLNFWSTIWKRIYFFIKT